MPPRKRSKGKGRRAKKAAAEGVDAATGGNLAAAADKKKPATAKSKVIISKSSIAQHKKWQDEAVKFGGPNARLVLNKPDAKKVIFDMLYDELCAMNIVKVYEKLKATIPLFVLKECIADMITDKYSDDDDGKSSKEKLDPYAGSLRLKEGGNIQNNLYYDDHNKLSNEGSGLIPDELLCIQRSKAECDQLNQQLKSITVEANQLESEPRSEDLILEVVDLESNKYMDDALEDDMAHAANKSEISCILSDGELNRQNELNEESPNWGEKNDEIQCNHGFQLAKKTLSRGHPVSAFIQTFFMGASDEMGLSDNLRNSVAKQPEVWSRDNNRKRVIEILTSVGTNFLLDKEDSPVLDHYIAAAIMVFEHYNGSDDVESAIRSYSALKKLRDLQQHSGSRRDVLKFFSKRVTCSCLTDMYRTARKTLPKNGKCNHCQQEHARVCLMVCSQCHVSQFCSRACQAANWHKHKDCCVVLATVRSNTEHRHRAPAQAAVKEICSTTEDESTRIEQVKGGASAAEYHDGPAQKQRQKTMSQLLSSLSRELKSTLIERVKASADKVYHDDWFYDDGSYPGGDGRNDEFSCDDTGRGSGCNNNVCDDEWYDSHDVFYCGSNRTPSGAEDLMKGDVA